MHHSKFARTMSLRVKLGRTQSEHISSEMRSTADIRRVSRIASRDFMDQVCAEPIKSCSAMALIPYR